MEKKCVRLGLKMSIFLTKIYLKPKKYFSFLSAVTILKQNLNANYFMYQDTLSFLKLKGILIKKKSFYSNTARFCIVTTITKEKLILSFPLYSDAVTIK